MHSPGFYLGVCRMGNANARFGTDRERKALKLLIEDGWVAGRTPGSKSPLDIWAMKAGEGKRLIQVKGTAAGPFADFGPAARAALVELAERGGAVAWLLWWPRGNGPVWFSQDEWP